MNRAYFCHPLLHARDWQDRPQLEAVCRWWADGGAGACALIGIGGAGKTAIADRFLQMLPEVMPLRADLPKRANLRPPERLFVFSFYDAPNPDSFFAELFDFLCPPGGQEQSAEDGGANARRPSYQQTLLALQSAGSCLLMLDGLEKVQDDGVRGGIFGEVQDGRLSDLLVRLAEGYLPQVSVLITSRFPLALLDELGSYYYRPIEVEEIDVAAAVKLLKQRGVRGTDDQLSAIARDCGLHALTVDLTGGYIAEFGGGDPGTPLKLTRFEDEEEARRAEPTNVRRRAVRIQEYRFARIAERYRAGFKERDPAALALLERICLFRLGVTAAMLASIFTGTNDKKPRIAGAALAGLTREQLGRTLERLEAMKLIEVAGAFSRSRRQDAAATYSIHPAVRDGFLAGLDADTRRHGHEAARSSLNAALYEARDRDLADAATLDLLEEILHHTLQSGHVHEAWDIYNNRLGGSKNLIWRLGAYERGARICRAFAGGASPESFISLHESAFFRRAKVLNQGANGEFSIPYQQFFESDRAFFINEWAVYLTGLGRLEAAARCYELFIQMRMEHDRWRNACIGNQNLCDTWLRSGRLTGFLRTQSSDQKSVPLSTGALETANEALRLAELANDAAERRDSHAYRACARGLRGEVSSALADFHAALNWQHTAERNERPLYSVRGIQHTQLVARLGRHEETTRLTEANIAITAVTAGAGNPIEAKCNLILATVLCESGKPASAEQCCASAHDWALTRDAKEILCWSALVKANIELSKAYDPDGGEATAAQGCDSALTDGLKIARDCGFGIFHIDLLLTRARRRLRQGDPQAALDDLRVALDYGIPADAHTGRPELSAALHPECGYAWGIAEGLSLRGEALLLQAAQSLGQDSFIPANRHDLPPQVRELIAQAETWLTASLDHWHPLRDPAHNNANLRHPKTRKQYNYRAAETYRVLTDLSGGVLTRHFIKFTSPKTPPVTLVHVGGGKAAAEMATPRPVFVSYAHKDNEGTSHEKRWLDRLCEHLEPLVQQDSITLCSDKDIDVGDDWHKQIQTHLDGARAAVLLVSPAFLASKYIRSSELPILLKNAKDQGVCIIPVILRPCLFAETKFKYPDPKSGPDEFSLSSLQASGSPDKALSEMNEGEQDRALLKVAQRLAKLVNP